MKTKFLFGPPTPKPLSWSLVIVGIMATVMAGLGLFGAGVPTLIMLLLGLQLAMVGSAELVSNRPPTMAWLVALSRVAGISVLAIASFYFWDLTR